MKTKFVRIDQKTLIEVDAGIPDDIAIANFHERQKKVSNSNPQHKRNRGGLNKKKRSEEEELLEGMERKVEESDDYSEIGS